MNVKAVSTIAREIRRLRAIYMDTSLDDPDYLRVRDSAHALEWALGLATTRPSSDVIFRRKNAADVAKGQ